MGGGVSKEYSKKRKLCKAELRRMRSRRDAFGIRAYKDVRWEFMQLLEKQKGYWKQRAKQFWLK